jgi:hypothetical protein
LPAAWGGIIWGDKHRLAEGLARSRLADNWLSAARVYMQLVAKVDVIPVTPNIPGGAIDKAK